MTQQKALVFFIMMKKKVVRKIKIKNEKKKQLIKEIINAHNKEMSQLLFLKSEELKSVNVVAGSMQSLIRSGNVEGARKLRIGIGEILSPIRKSVLGNEKNTDLKLKVVLSEKQFKSWIKFKKNKKKSLQPKKATSNRPSSRRRGGGNRNRRN